MAVQFNRLPVTPLRVTSKFGKRNTGIQGASTNHKGIDLGRDFNKSETTVLAVAGGTITNNYWDNTRGWVVIIDHGEFKTLYQHLKAQSPAPKGSKVVAGQVIGIMGASTKTIKNMAMHLHMELITDGKQIDPLPYLKNIQPIEMEKKDMTREETLRLIKEVLAGTDNDPSRWHKEDWEKATKEGITDGKKPQGYCTREQVVTMIERGSKIK